MSKAYRKFSITITGGLTHGGITHTQQALLETAKGNTVTVKERWLEDQGAGPTEGEPRDA